MWTNRFGILIPAETPVAPPTVSSAFVTCPCSFLVAPAHQAFAAEVYRLAYERTQEQLRPAARPLRFAHFSLN
ncbi:MAG TPA: hypothetical protein VM597_17135 [Gemmataceae bacterium]|jgi:hypothetical protein|nr:hypothetical protein [Gemmataceae bacterium]